MDTEKKNLPGKQHIILPIGGTGRGNKRYEVWGGQLVVFGKGEGVLGLLQRGGFDLKELVQIGCKPWVQGICLFKNLYFFHNKRHLFLKKLRCLGKVGLLDFNIR